MRKEDLVEQVYDANSVIGTKTRAEKIVNSVFEKIGAALANGQEVRITRFGVFLVKQVRERKGVNPRTGEAITIPARKKVAFRVSKTLKEAVQ